MAGVVHIPWYATGFRGDKLEAALAEIAPIALRYGGTHYSVYRFRDDRYKFLQTATFEDKMDWERYWYSETVAEKRVELAGTYQVPLLPTFHEVVGEGKALILAPAEPS